MFLRLVLIYFLTIVICILKVPSLRSSCPNFVAYNNDSKAITDSQYFQQFLGRHGETFPSATTHLVDVDGDSDDDVQQVTERQAADQDVWSIAHALVLVDDPQ